MSIYYHLNSVMGFAFLVLKNSYFHNKIYKQIFDQYDNIEKNYRSL